MVRCFEYGLPYLIAPNILDLNSRRNVTAWIGTSRTQGHAQRPEHYLPTAIESS